MRQHLVFIIILIILASAAACQQTFVSQPPPTADRATPRPLLLNATQPPRAIAGLPPATATPIPPPDAAARASATPLIDPRPLTRTAPPTALPPGWFEVGRTAEGRAITARRFGDGPRALLLVGGIHGGWEANTVALVEELVAHFEANPADVLPGLALVLIPAANPDGLARVEAAWTSTATGAASGPPRPSGATSR